MAKARTLVLNTKVNVTGADQLRGLGKTLQKTGGLLTAGLTLPLVGVGAAMLTAAQDAERAQAKLSNTFKSMGAAAFTSVKALNAHAEALQNATTFDDESINEAQAVLLTFGKVTGDSFTRATEAALDMTALFEGDLQAATIGIGKALNDPIKGVTALTRVGVSFTAQQKDQIKALAESGDLLGAQTIILAELEKQFGGTAEALAGTASGQMTQALNQLGEAAEEFGKIIAPVLVDVAKGLKEFAKWLRQLNPETKEWVLRIGLLAAALGPVLIVVGTLVRTFAALKVAGLLLARVAPLIGASFHLMLGPLGLVTAGVTTLAAAFATDFLGVRTRFEKDMGDIGDILGDAGDAFRGFFGIVEEGTGIEAMAESEKAGWAAFQDRIDTTITAAGEIVTTGVTDMATAMGEAPGKMADELLANQFSLTDATAQLVAFMEQALTPAQELFQLQGFLASAELAAGLASNNPLIKRKAEEMRDAALLALSELDKSAFNYGVTFTEQYAAGIVNALGVIKDAGRQLGGALRGQVAINSEPSDPSSPLRGITKWGGNIATTLADGALRELGTLRRAANAMAGAIVPSFGAVTPAFAVAGGGMGGGTTNIYNNFTFSGTPSGSPNELSSLLRDLSAVSGGDVRYG